MFNKYSIILLLIIPFSSPDIIKFLYLSNIIEFIDPYRIKKKLNYLVTPNILYLTSISILKFPYTQTTLQGSSNNLIVIDLFYSNNHLGHFIVLRSWFLFILFLIVHIDSRSLISKCSIWNNKFLRLNNYTSMIFRPPYSIILMYRHLMP